MWSNYNRVRLEISNTGDFKGNKRNYIELNENKNTAYQNCGIRLKAVMREIHSTN